MERKKNVLFLCTGNSARSQMAEGLLRQIAGDRFEVMSAGLEPKDEVHPLAVEVMREIGIDIGAQKPKAVDVFLGRVPVHYLIVVCNRAQATCPRIWPGLMDGNRYYWPVDDPVEATGGIEGQLAVFRVVRDELQEKLREWVNAL
ncbi:protein tyrosine phosphatase [Chlorobium limicola DSM 245]|uniref:Protein tyrosine phosphatase n=1 Tax=Chlorobium limicola (strain DSM 245 / NBRC 103803 / 6330) TaxID=290315 RepID=B3EFU1_CHLL2|nr:arsenate reductase ArsC [Chlorobium limicola]ACD89474.1 protein tyrosine phosphatase [Chlorobium limicola DSM 245]